MLLGETRKHSYRVLAQRQLAKMILYFVENKDQKPILGFVRAKKGEMKRLNTAYKVAHELIKDSTAGKEVNLYSYAPYKNEIRKALNKTNSTEVNQLTFNI